MFQECLDDEDNYDEDQEIPAKKIKFETIPIIYQQQSPLQIKQNTSNRSDKSFKDQNNSVTEIDEDVSFGNTIGCMLKKIPAHLKTSVKLRLLNSLEEFEIQNNLKKKA